MGIMDGQATKMSLTPQEQAVFDEVREAIFRERPSYRNQIGAIALIDELAYRMAKRHVAQLTGNESAMREYSTRIGTLLSQLNIRPDVAKQDARQDEGMAWLMARMQKAMPATEPAKALPEARAEIVLDAVVEGEEQPATLKITDNNSDASAETSENPENENE